ncbi:MAG: CDP-diacylglycerol--glycerol-3-phosphate 3-phosphatidyltransferase [Bacillota bacterium]
MEEKNITPEEIAKNQTTEEVIESEIKVEVSEKVADETADETVETVAETVAETESANEAEPAHEVSLAEKIELAEKHHAKSNAHQKMNLPNKLSLLRIALVPIMVILFYIQTPIALTCSVLVFIIASITDFLDGHIARKYNLVTDFGKFIDPIADKLLVVTALVLISVSGIVLVPYVAEISLMIVIAREFAISGLRLIAATNGTVIAADKLGKLKTVTQIVAIILLLSAYSVYVTYATYYYSTSVTTEFLYTCYMTALYTSYVGTAIYAISTVICIISGISYLVKNKSAFMNSK